ncbi:glutathione S-transferase N-terminal domain-containing protein [Pseudoalteromonas fenneropenaei]|uniref:Glutathione S-transferase N-terminal domain-containing protein n=1 Tax=Pseudoalteromonas fenneropenaei TaxID=1737459 RepID=A0ABV7CC61_9GAMM
MKLVRWLLGRIILFFDFITTPRGVKRDAKLQAQIDTKTASLSLYQFHACPFCVKVRRAIKRNNLKIELRDAKAEGMHRQALLEQGGKVKVPCLRIEQGDQVTWLYESNDIIRFLEQEVVEKAA